MDKDKEDEEGIASRNGSGCCEVRKGSVCKMHNMLMKIVKGSTYADVLDLSKERPPS